MRTNQDLYTGSVFLALVSALFLFAGWLHLQQTSNLHYHGSKMQNLV
jgi:hypothetical protein